MVTNLAIRELKKYTHLLLGEDCGIKAGSQRNITYNCDVLYFHCVCIWLAIFSLDLESKLKLKLYIL